MKKSQAKKHIRKVHVQAAKLQEQVPQVPTPNVVAPILKPIMIACGGQKTVDGTWKNYAEKDAAQVAIVTAELLTRYSQDRKHVIKDMAYNFLALGAKLPEHLLNLSAPFWAERSMKEHKRQWKYLLENANAESAQAAWKAEVNARKRIDPVTIQALAKAVRHMKAGGQTERVSPVGKLARDVLAVLNDRTMDADARFAALRTMCEAKAEYKATVQEKKQAAA